MATSTAAPQEKEEEEAIRSLEHLHAALLEAAGRRRVRGDDIKRRCLDFVKMELSGIVALLKSSNTPLQAYYSGQWKDLDELVRYVELTRYAAANKYSHRHRRNAVYCCSEMERKCRLLENAGRYRHLLSSRSDDAQLPRSPQVAEVGGVPLVGIDRPMNKLLWWLQESNNRSLSVMSIVGPVGIGKTALAMDLHNRLKCQATGGRYHFHCNVMAQMTTSSTTSTDHDKRHEILLQDILSKIPSLEPFVELVTTVSMRLQNKRYFICIDGMRDAPDWDRIKGAFPDNNLGSRILITTRDGRIEWWSYYDILVHQMKPLNRLDSEMLLLTRVFGYSQQDGAGWPGMSPSFSGFLDACGGIPLFINVLADLFPKEMWHSAESSGEEADRYAVWFAKKKKDRYAVLRRALLSHNNFGSHILYRGFFEVAIPYQLKMILLYMSMFSYGYKFEKDSLITKWINEGLARDSIEAEMWFSQLIQWNIITWTAQNCRSSPETPDGAEARQLHMNYFMQVYLASKSAEIGFAFTHAMLNLAAASTPRRLVLNHSDPMIPTLPQNLDLSQTRSLAVSGAVDGVPLHEFVNLVVLDLEGWEKLTDDVLRQVCTCKMFLLKYLSIRNTQVSKLPHEIKNLLSLRLLDISYTQISELPLEVFKLQLLEEMFLRGTRIMQLPKQIVELKNSLHSIILGDEGMVNSNGTSIKVPHDIQHLYDLEKLDTIDLTEQPASFVKALGSLTRLRFLAITWSFHQSSHRSYREALLSSIKEWRHLISLTIHCELGCSMEFLGSLSDPSELLQKFKVTVGRFASVPKWIRKLDCLSFLQITICKQGPDDLKLLGDLWNLQCLILGLDLIPGEAIEIGNDGFRKLQRLSIDCPMPWLSFSTGAMRNLRYLQLKFRSIPESKFPSGIENLGSLTEVVLCYSKHYAYRPSVKMTVEAVKKQVAKHCNPIDLFINGTEHDVQTVEKETGNSVATQSGTKAEIKYDVSAVNEELVVDAATEVKSTCEIEEIQSDA